MIFFHKHINIYLHFQYHIDQIALPQKHYQFIIKYALYLLKDNYFSLVFKIKLSIVHKKTSIMYVNENIKIKDIN